MMGSGDMVYRSTEELYTTSLGCKTGSLETLAFERAFSGWVKAGPLVSDDTQDWLTCNADCIFG